MLLLQKVLPGIVANAENVTIIQLGHKTKNSLTGKRRAE